MNFQERLKLAELNLKRLTIRADADKWITLNGGSKKDGDGGGSHVLLDGQGNIKAGAGGKFNGLKVSDIKKQGDKESHASITGKAFTKAKQERLEYSDYKNDLSAYENRQKKIADYWKSKGDRGKQEKAAQEQYKKDLADYNALSKKDKAAKDKWGVKLHQKPTPPQNSFAPEPLDKPNKSDYDYELSMKHTTTHESPESDLFSGTSGTTTRYEFDDSEDASNYVDAIGYNLGRKGYDHSVSENADIYTKDNHSVIVNHNLDDDNEEQDEDWKPFVSVKSGYFDESAKGHESIAKNTKQSDMDNIIETIRQKGTAHEKAQEQARAFIDKHGKEAFKELVTKLKDGNLMSPAPEEKWSYSHIQNPYGGEGMAKKTHFYSQPNHKGIVEVNAFFDDVPTAQEDESVDKAKQFVIKGHYANIYYIKNASEAKVDELANKISKFRADNPKSSSLEENEFIKTLGFTKDSRGNTVYNEKNAEPITKEKKQTESETKRTKPHTFMEEKDNDGTVKRGMYLTSDGEYTALTRSQSKTFKTEKAAKDWLEKTSGKPVNVEQPQKERSIAQLEANQKRLMDNKAKRQAKAQIEVNERTAKQLEAAAAKRESYAAFKDSPELQEQARKLREGVDKYRKAGQSENKELANEVSKLNSDVEQALKEREKTHDISDYSQRNEALRKANAKIRETVNKRDEKELELSGDSKKYGTFNLKGNVNSASLKTAFSKKIPKVGDIIKSKEGTIYRVKKININGVDDSDSVFVKPMMQVIVGHSVYGEQAGYIPIPNEKINEFRELKKKLAN